MDNKKKSLKKFKNQKNIKSKTQLTNEEIERLTEKLPGIKDYNTDEISSFAKLPISNKTLKGLKENDFTVPTKVQRQTLIHSLRGVDLVAAAKTGSGKTLAFMIPLLEELFRNKWSITDGLGAIIITPTRELAYQIHELLKKVGVHHYFSSALVIGGKDWKYEKYSVGKCNILICTPGRLLHHITTYTNFDCSNLQVLVLDEADMCLSMGFAKEMNAILDELPKNRKTWLFSATQTKDVKNLVRAGCQDPIFCSVHEMSKTSTPKTLKESYVVCDVEDKINFLFSFLKHHKKKKILVFLATCKQVRYINSVFRQLRPGLSVLNIHGAMHQLRRMAVYDEFCRKEHAVLFATDVAARGLDIPFVDWVIQFDCPEDVTAYIHRAGRTARYSQPGESILIVTPSEEEEMIRKLKLKHIPIEKIEADSRKLQDIQRLLENILVKQNHILQEAQRAFKSYIKNVALMKDKKVFDPFSINSDAFAKSLGLEVTPRIRFLERKLKNNKEGFKVDMNEIEDDEDDDDFLVSNKNTSLPEDDSGMDETSPSKLLEEISPKKSKKVITKAAVAKKLLKRNIQVNSKISFDDEGEAIVDNFKSKPFILNNDDTSNISNNQTISIEKLKETMRQEDKVDKKIYTDRQKAKKKQEKAKLKEERKAKHTKDESDDEEDTNDIEDYSDDETDEDTQDIIDSLPDPDKVYGKKDEESDKQDSNEASDDEDSSHSDSSNDDEDSESSDDEPKLSGKRLAKQKARDTKRARLAQSNQIEQLPISEQEQLALYLLNNK